jgi:hypothetical protein
MRSNSKTYHRKFLSSFPNHKISDRSFMHDNVYHNNFIVIIFVLKLYKMIVKKYSFRTIAWVLEFFFKP